ncbi:LexA family protein [Thermoflexus sp.]|uniref:LexA family protein n=1 Tax=Thermoflexus sp. TaxID=1969742 RepID=UPI0017575A50|nr:S24 family peptidase [Thermoflexus sp.]
MADRDRLLSYLEAYWETHGYGPTLEEIRRQMGFASRSHALYHLRALVQKGLVAREPRKHRTWRPVSLPPPPVSIPLKGVVPASSPDQMAEVIPQDLGTLRLPAAWVPHRCRFALWVRGESMIGRGIQPYDIVLIEPVTWSEVRSGDLVVARLRGRNQLTLKELAIEQPKGAARKNEAIYWLRPAHPELPPIRLDRRMWVLEGRVAFRFGPVRDLGAIIQEG